MLEVLMLRAKEGSEAGLRSFYGTKLGLEELGPLEFRPNPESATLKFVLTREDETNVDNECNYWKIGLTVDLLDGFLESRGFKEKAKQFRDIGYLTHVTDPEGYTVELLQTTFEANKAGRRGKAVSKPRAIGQISLRVKDIETSLGFYRDRLGMKLLSIQAVTDFTLYFLAFTDDDPPSSNLRAVENREWLWQRPYTTLELQHRHDNNATALHTSSLVEGIVLGLDHAKYAQVAAIQGLDQPPRRFILKDPDGLFILVTPSDDDAAYPSL